jgi:hypothetical protein
MISIILINLAAVDGAVGIHSFEQLVRLDDRAERSDFAEDRVPDFQNYWLQIKDKVLNIGMPNNAI